MLKATLRSIAGHKVRLAMTGLAVVLGVTLMGGTLVLTDTIGKTFDDLYADLYDGTDAVVRSSEVVESAFGEDQRPSFDAQILEQVLELDEVQTAAGEVLSYAQIIDPDGEPVLDPGMGPPTLGANWTDDERLNPFDLDDGRPPESDDEVVIDRRSADTGSIEVGDTVTILSPTLPREMTVSGIVTFGEIESPGGASLSMFTLETARELFDSAGQFDEIAVVAAEGVSEEELTEAISVALPDGMEAVTGATAVEEQQDTIAEAMSFFSTFLLIFAVIALVVGAFIIYNTFSIILAQRSRELALLRALGASRRQVLSSVLAEAFIVGLLASVVGLGLGVLAAQGLKELLGALGLDIPATGLVVTLGTVLTCVIVGVVITLVAAIMPAWRSSRIAPIAALREATLDSGRGGWLRIAVGALILLSGLGNIAGGLVEGGQEAFAAVGVGSLLVFVGITVLGPVLAKPLARALAWPLPKLRGITGTIARENASRSPRRTANTAAALMVGVGLVGFIALVADSARASIDEIIDENFASDLIIDSGQFFVGGVSPELAEEVRAVEGVEAATGVRMTEATINDEATLILGTDTEVISRITDPDVSEGEFVDLGDGEMAVSSTAAENNDWAVGDTVAAALPGGEYELTVAGTYEDDLILGEQVLDLEFYSQVVPTQLDFQVYILTEPGVQPEDLRGELDEAIAPWPTASVQDISEFKEAQAAEFNQLLTLIYALLLLAIVIALVGIANTLALSVFERTRELGLMRAVGMTRSQLRSAVRWESIIIAVYGTLIGLVLGVVFGAAMVSALGDEGLQAMSIPVGTLVVVVILAGLAGVLAALLPARRAAKLDILNAISAE